MNNWQQPEPLFTQEVSKPPVREESPFWDYRDLGLFLAALLPAFVAAALIVKAVFWGFGFSGRNQTPEGLAAQFLGYGLWFFALFIILREKYGQPFWKSLGWIRPFEKFWGRVGWGILLAFGVAVGALFLEAPQIDMPIKRMLTDRFSILLVGFLAATLGPMFEELAFRGFLLPLLVRSLGVFLGILATAIPFALVHGWQYGWSWRHLLFIWIAGIAFGLMRYRSGSTAAATVMHASYNLTFFSLFVINLIVNPKAGPVKW